MQSVLRRSVSCGNILQRASGVIALSPRAGGVVTSSIRFYPAVASKASSEANEPEKSVFISQSSDVFTNLALEDWMYKNFDFQKHRVLLLWRNDPCVVIGRHQNPWQEVDVGIAEKQEVPVVRRNSGGGTVYHDRGNLNCTFFTPRNAYDRKTNLDILCRALQRQFGIKTEMSPRLDVTLDGYKISGTASKLGKNAYHHCTVLVDADLKSLSKLLSPDTEGLDSRATKSIKSPVQNVKEANVTVSPEKVLSSVGYEFLRTDQDGNDGGAMMIQKQRGFQMINPTNDWFPGLDALKAEMKSWSWNFGKTPEFTLKKEYQIGQDESTLDALNLEFNLQVKDGYIRYATLQAPSCIHKTGVGLVDSSTMSDLSGFINALKDRPFHPGIISTFEGLLFKNNKASVSIHETWEQNGATREVVRNS